MDRLERLKPLALLLMRCALGLIFMFHGKPKLFGQTAAFMQFFTRLGIPAQLVYFVGVLELFGGALLILGLFTRVPALLLAIEMGVAIWKVHLVHGVYSVRDFEFPLALLTAALTLATVGAGAISLDQAIFGKRPRAKGRD